MPNAARAAKGCLIVGHVLARAAKAAGGHPLKSSIKPSGAAHAGIRASTGTVRVDTAEQAVGGAVGAFHG